MSTNEEITYIHARMRLLADANYSGKAVLQDLGPKLQELVTPTLSERLAGDWVDFEEAEYLLGRAIGIVPSTVPLERYQQVRVRESGKSTTDKDLFVMLGSALYAMIESGVLVDNGPDGDGSVRWHKDWVPGFP